MNPELKKHIKKLFKIWLICAIILTILFLAYLLYASPINNIPPPCDKFLNKNITIYGNNSIPLFQCPTYAQNCKTATIK